MPESEVYMPGQVKEVFPWMDGIEWFILGGPADGDEAKVLKAAYPHVMCLACEPNPDLRRIQQLHGHPNFLLPFALWHKRETLQIKVNGGSRLALRNTTVARDGVGILPGEGPERTITVNGLPLDELHLVYGPFRNALLWLDIEGSEMFALQGAEWLLRNGRVNLINIEVFANHEPFLNDYLGERGFLPVHRWGEGADDRGSWCNKVYLRQEQT